jgi:hypothetical protein
MVQHCSEQQSKARGTYHSWLQGGGQTHSGTVMRVHACRSETALLQ